jgi:hypothetical protein
VLLKPKLHQLDFRSLICNDLLRQTAHLRILAIQQLGLRHLDRGLMMRKHQLDKVFVIVCVWLYFRFALSFHDVEEMLAMRGVALSYERVREWCLKFGQTYANALRRKSPQPGDRWHLDEVFLSINGRVHFRVGRHRYKAHRYRAVMKARLTACLAVS